MSVFFRHALLRVPLRDFRSRSKLFGVEFITRHVRFFRTCPTAGSASGLPPLGHCFVVGDTRHQLRASMSAGWRGSAGRFAETLDSRPTGQLEIFCSLVGLDDNLDIFFLGRIPTLARLQCRAGGAAGWRTRSAKNMFIRHVLRHVEAIKRNPGRVEVPRLGAAGM